MGEGLGSSKHKRFKLSLLLFVGSLTSQQHASVPRDQSAQTIPHGTKLRQKLQTELLSNPVTVSWHRVKQSQP